MYPNVRAEMVRRGLTQRKMVSDLADRGCKMSLSTFCNKMTGKSEFTFGELLAVKAVLETDMPLEMLFARRAS